MKRVASKPRASKRDAAMLPLLNKLIIPEGVEGAADSHGLRDPTVLYMLARQQYGGLTALTVQANTAFALAQAELSSMLTKEDIAVSGAHAFQIAVDHVKACPAVSAAFRALFSATLGDAWQAALGGEATDAEVGAFAARATAAAPSSLVDATATARAAAAGERRAIRDAADAADEAAEAEAMQRACISRMLEKFFNSAGAEFRTQVESIWVTAAGKGGVAIRQELKVLQQKAAGKIEAQHPVTFDAERALAMCAADLHRLLAFAVHVAPESIIQGSQKAHLVLMTRAYHEQDRDAQLGGTKGELGRELVELVKRCEADGFARPVVLRGGGGEGGGAEGGGGAGGCGVREREGEGEPEREREREPEQEPAAGRGGGRKERAADRAGGAGKAQRQQQQQERAQQERV